MWRPFFEDRLEEGKALESAGKDWNIMEDKILWRKVQVRKCASVLLIFLGLIGMQMLSSIVCVAAYVAGWIGQGDTFVQVLQKLQAGIQFSDDLFLIWVSLVSATLCLIWCGILYYRSGWRIRPFPYRQAFSLRTVAAIVSCGAGACVVLTMVVSVLELAFPQAFTAYEQLMSQISYETSWVTVVYVIAIGPISEELIFRGAILDRLRIPFPFWVANLLQGALFGLYHMNLIQGLYAWCLGAILGLILNVTGSIFSSILAHIVFNSTSYCLSMLFSQEGGSGYGQLLVEAAGFIFLTLGLSYFLQEYRRQTVEKEEKTC